MNTSEAKVLLQSYRVGTGDDIAQEFRAALRKLESDPELAAWFRAEQEFDAVMSRKFNEVPVNPATKERILRALAVTAEVSDPAAESEKPTTASVARR